MPASPSRYVRALSQAAVVMKPGSKNQTPGRSFDHSLADTPPLTMGISRVSPFLLSVIVMLSATCRALQFLNSMRHDPRTTNGWGRHSGHPGYPLVASHEAGATCSGTCVAVPAVSVWPAGGITWT